MKVFTRKRASKKASLSLSMEAIVILILAVTMLGLGLTFVRNMFGNITDKASNAIDVADLTAKPSEGEPVVFSPSSPVVKLKDQIQVQVGFYNPSTSTTWWKMIVEDNEGECGSPFSDDAGVIDCSTGLETTYRSKPFKLEKDQATGYNIIFKPRSGTGVSFDFGGAAKKAVLLSVKFCSVAATTDTSGTVTEPDAEATCDGSEYYQKEIFLTVRQ